MSQVNVTPGGGTTGGDGGFGAGMIIGIILLILIVIVLIVYVGPRIIAVPTNTRSLIGAAQLFI